MLLACAWTALTPAISAAQSFRPPNLRPHITSVEAGLWQEADKAEAFVKMSGDLNRDPQLTAYVRNVVCHIAQEYCGELRIYVVDRPVFNAQVSPNGCIEVNSGLLLRARTEDELAYVLGHEVTHFARNHTLREFDHEKRTRNTMLALQVGVTLGAAAAMYSAASSGSPYASTTIDSISRSAQSLNNLIYLAGIAKLFSYGREAETEADQLGFDRYRRANYAPGAAAAIWRSVEDENAASDFEAVRKSDARASIFDTHPITPERIKALSALAGPAAQQPTREAELRYRDAIRPQLANWLKDDLRRKDFGQTLYLLDRLAEPGVDGGVINFYRGEAYRLRRRDGDQTKAVAAYRQAVAHPDAPVAAWRELGESLKRTGDRAGAAAALAAYLEKAPDADDAWLVEASLKTLQSVGTP